MTKKHSQAPDPRDFPLYTFPEAAWLLEVPVSTLRSWIAGRDYPIQRGKGRFAPLIKRPDESDPRLSFRNLIEANSLLILRKQRDAPMHKIRRALEYAEKEAGIKNLLIHEALKEDAGELFLDEYGRLTNMSRSGQLSIKATLTDTLRKVQYDVDSLAIRLFPFKYRGAGTTKIAVDPRIAFGKAMLVGRGITIGAIRMRYDGGEKVAQIARDYDLDEAEVREAIIYDRAA